jgi:hypothetical protein
MTGLETNIFPITNLAELASTYRLYRIRGLRRDQAEYHQNRQVIARKLSFTFRTPAAVVDHAGEPHLVLRADAPEPVSPYPLVRRSVYFDRVPEIRHLDYTLRTTENDEICLRFIQFTLQNPLSANPRLWQPGSGKPFFEKAAALEHGDLVRYAGFAVRAVPTPDGGIGLCVDVRHKIVGRDPLPMHLSRDAFRPWRGRHCIYHYGHKWYDVQLHEFSDLNVSEESIRVGDKMVPLLEYVVSASQKPIPEELARLVHDGSVIYYQNNLGESRSAPAALCYPVFDTHGEEARRHHGGTILKPYERREHIRRYAGQYLRDLRFGDVTLRVSAEPNRIPQKMFLLPDLEFGNSRVLSVRGTPGAQHVSLDSVGRTRAALLRDKDAGFYVGERLDRQYLFLPQSVADSFGQQFVADLRRTVDELYPQGGGYDPIVIPYSDRGPRTFVEQGNAIWAAAEANCTKPGYGLVMVHHTTDRMVRQHDQLAAMVIRKFRELDVFAAVNHSAMGQECYQLAHGRDGQPIYRVRQEKWGKFSGYLRNVALNKVLLTNEKWPFVLASPLHADITVGIDVKQNTAGFTIVGRNGGQVRTICRESSQKEQLQADQVRKYLTDILRKEAALGVSIGSIVVHRDGRAWPSERDGMRRALDALKAEGAVAADATLTILEIPKTSPVPLRLFETAGENGRRPWVENPQVGCYHIINGVEGYLCATGRAFPHPGTVQPLHVRYVEGAMPFEDCLEDLYSLTALAWTRPEDCTRHPITIKLTDRRLGEDASEYDADALEFEEAEESNA